jgi:LDH2 family malate/lactate/ureidoglycolate dehydrogenase
MLGTTQRYPASYLHALTRQLFMAVETPRHIADVVAGILVNANLAGHDSHGVLRIPAYLGGISAGRLNPAAEPEISKESATTFVIDGKNGFGHYTAFRAMSRAVEKARASNVCCVGFVNTTHIGRLGEYVEMAARAGCIGLITHGLGGQDSARVVPFGGARGALSTNPIAVGVPTGEAAPFVLDIATSVVAEGKLQVARSKGANVPEGYIVDKEGRPTVKTTDFYDGGFLLPFGAHKGYGLGLLIAMLGGLGGGFDLETGSVRGELMQVINVEAFTPLDIYQQGMRALLQKIRAIPPAPGFHEVLVPGDFEQRSRTTRLAEGIELPETIQRQLLEQADALGVSVGEELVEAEDRERYQVEEWED